MNIKLNIEELDEETRNRIGLPADPREEVSKRLVVMGRVLALLKGFTRSDGIWILSQGLYAVQKEASAQEDVGVQEEELKPIGFILYTVAKMFDLEISDLVVRKRSAEVVEARQVAMYILWNAESYTLTEIGRALGGRSAATVSHGYKQTARRLKTDGRLRRKLEKAVVEIGKGEFDNTEYLLKEGGF